MNKILFAVLTFAILSLLTINARAVNTCTGYNVSHECIPAENILEGTLPSGVQGSGCGATNLPQGVAITYGLSAATVTTTDTSAGSLVVGGGIKTGTGVVQLVDATGKITAISSTYFASLSGANLTGIPAAAVSAGSLGTGAFTVTGAFNATTSISAASALAVTAGPLQPYQRTKAQLHALTPAVGDVYVCSDCTNTYTLVVGTGTVVNGFREVGTATGAW
jgi:hypothetical protein